MQGILRWLGVCVALAVTVGLSSAPASAASSSRERAVVQAASKAGQVRGELLHVDVGAQTLTVREADGAVMKFRYTDHTVVTGGGKSVAGLAKGKSERVVVHYEIEKQSDGRDPAFVATRIEVSSSKR